MGLKFVEEGRRHLTTWRDQLGPIRCVALADGGILGGVEPPLRGRSKCASDEVSYARTPREYAPQQPERTGSVEPRPFGASRRGGDPPPSPGSSAGGTR